MSNPVDKFVFDKKSRVGNDDSDIFTLEAKANNNNNDSTVGKLFEDDKESLLPKPPMKSSPMKMTCPRCHQQMKTKTRYKNSVATYLFCFLCCITGGCIFCCCWIPFCMGSCQKVEHNCSKCHQYLGHYYPR